MRKDNTGWVVVVVRETHHAGVSCVLHHAGVSCVDKKSPLLQALATQERPQG